MKISVITVCYNAGRTIGDTISSVVAQDWPDYEHIVVDGASSDQTIEIVTAMQHDRMVFVSERDRGIYDAMNKGLALASGDYVGFLNADDYLSSPQALRVIAEKALQSDADCILGDTCFVDDNGQPKGRFYSSRGFAKWWLRIGAMPPHPSLYARRTKLLEANGFDERYRIAADFDLVARMILTHQASWVELGKTTTCFRTGGISTSGGGARRQISRDMADSLGRMGHRWPRARVLLRYPLKVLQYAARPR